MVTRVRKSSDPMYVSKERKKELRRLLADAIKKYPLKQAWEDVTRELKAQKAAAAR